MSERFLVIKRVLALAFRLQYIRFLEKEKGTGGSVPLSLPRTGLRGICHAIITVAVDLSRSFVQSLFQQKHIPCACNVSADLSITHKLGLLINKVPSSGNIL